MTPAQQLIDKANTLSLCLKHLFEQYARCQQQAASLRFELTKMREKLGVEK